MASLITRIEKVFKNDPERTQKRVLAIIPRGAAFYHNGLVRADIPPVTDYN